MRSSFVQLVVLIAVMLASGLVKQSAWAEYRIAAIALSGDIAPGSGGSGADVAFAPVLQSYPVLNLSGEVAFHTFAELNADGGYEGIFSTAGGSLHTVAFEQQIVPGSGGAGPDLPYIQLNRPTLNAAGEVAYSAILEPNIEAGNNAGSGNHVSSGSHESGVGGIFSTTGGALNTIVLTEQIAPGSGGSGADVPFIAFRHLGMTVAGEVGFVGYTSLNADGDTFGIFSTTGGALHAEVFEGRIAPGSGGSGADVPFTGFSHPVMSTTGGIVFTASTLENEDGGNTGIFSTSGGALHAIAFEGQIAPGSGGSGADVPFVGFLFDPAGPFGNPVINSAGDVVFLGITSANTDGRNSGIFSTAGGALHAVAFDGQIAPGSGGSGEPTSHSSVSTSLC